MLFQQTYTIKSNTIYKLLFAAITIIVSSFFSPFVNSQNVNSQPILSKENTYFSKSLTDASEICSNSTIEISFNTKGKQNLIIIESAEEKLINKKHNNNFVKRIYFDENSNIEYAFLKNNRGAKIKFEPIITDAIIDDVFDHDIKLLLLENKFDIKLEQFGVSYKKIYSDPNFFNRIYFTDIYPIFEKEISFKIPNWLNIEIVEMNFENYSIEKTIEAKKGVKTYSYKASNLPPFSNEENTPSIAKTYPHLVIMIKSFNVKDKEHSFIRNIDDLYEYYRSIISEVNNESEKLNLFVNDLIKDCKSDFNKIETLFYWVQDNIRYIAFESGIMGYKPEGAYSVFYNRYGDCKGKANLLKEMLIIAGIDAKLGWIGTNSIPYDYSLPSLLVDNHMICIVNSENIRYYLDATEEYIPVNEYAQRIQARQIIIQSGDSYIMDTIPIEKDDYNKTIMTYRCTYNDNKIEGKADLKFYGQDKVSLLRNYNSSNSTLRDQMLVKYLGKYDKNLQVLNVNHQNFDNRAKPLEISYDYILSNRVFVEDNSLYMNFEIEKEFYNYKIDTSRFNDYNFYSKKNSITQAEFVIPNGYVVDYIPNGVNISTEYFKFILNYNITNDIIEYSKEISILNPILSKNYFEEWNNAIYILNEFYSDQIVLQKKK